MNHEYEKGLVSKLRESGNLSNLSDQAIIALYREWSDVTYRASWFIVTESAISDFLGWCSNPPASEQNFDSQE